MRKIEYKKKIYWDKKQVGKLATGITRKKDSILWKKLCYQITKDNFSKT